MNRRKFILGIGAFAFVVVPGDASARVQLKQSNPAHNSHGMLREPEVELQFTEPVRDPEITVTDYAARVISVGVPEMVRDDLVVMQLVSPDPPRPLQGGEYIVQWRVTSIATGEVAQDSFHFFLHDHP